MKTINYSSLLLCAIAASLTGMTLGGRTPRSSPRSSSTPKVQSRPMKFTPPPPPARPRVVPSPPSLPPRAPPVLPPAVKVNPIGAGSKPATQGQFKPNQPGTTKSTVFPPTSKPLTKAVATPVASKTVASALKQAAKNPALTKFATKFGKPTLGKNGTPMRTGRKLSPGKAAAVGAAAGLGAGAIAYTIYNRNEYNNAYNYWNEFYNAAATNSAAVDQPLQNLCVKHEYDENGPAIDRRPHIICQGELIEEFACPLGYTDAELQNDPDSVTSTDTTLLAGYCVKNGFKVDKQWYIPKFQKNLVKNCPSDYDTQWKGVTRHCWKKCETGYTSHTASKSKDYYWCDKACPLERSTLDALGLNDYCIGSQ